MLYKDYFPSRISDFFTDTLKSTIAILGLENKKTPFIYYTIIHFNEDSGNFDLLILKFCNFVSFY